MGALPKLNFPPLAMNRDTALEYTGLAPKLFDELEARGDFSAKRIGRNGEKMYPREQLEAVTGRFWGIAALDLDDEVAGLNG